MNDERPPWILDVVINDDGTAEIGLMNPSEDSWLGTFAFSSGEDAKEAAALAQHAAAMTVKRVLERAASVPGLPIKWTGSPDTPPHDVPSVAAEMTR